VTRTAVIFMIEGLKAREKASSAIVPACRPKCNRGHPGAEDQDRLDES
jgi:hypothetical protein